MDFLNLIDEKAEESNYFLTNLFSIINFNYNKTI